MPDYCRNRIAGATYFFTVNLRDRGSTLLVERIDALRETLHAVRRRSPFPIDAWVVLPDHMHCLWTLPPGDSDFPGRWRDINRFLEMLAGERATLSVDDPPGRTRHLAAPILGAHDSRRVRLCGPHRLRPLQPGEAWPDRHAGEVAVFQLPAVGDGRALPG